MGVIEGAALEAYLPHRGAMRLIDRLLDVDDEHAVAEVEVPADGLFVADGQVGAWVGIEYMAQTIAAWAGARALRRGDTPQVGFLLGSRRYQARHPSFRAGCTLRIEVRCEFIGDNGLGQFDCCIKSPPGEVLASAMVSVFEPAPGAASEGAGAGLPINPTRESP